MNLPPSIDFRELERIILPHNLSIRVTPEPLELHWRGIFFRRFDSRKALVDYINMKIK